LSVLSLKEIFKAINEHGIHICDSVAVFANNNMLIFKKSDKI